MKSDTSFLSNWFAGAVWAALAACLAGCATTPPERYTPPADGTPTAEVQVRLMQLGGNSHVAFYVRGAARCAPTTVLTKMGVRPEAPPRLVAGSWERTDGPYSPGPMRRQADPVIRMPAGEPLGLLVQFEAPGQLRGTAMVVVLEPGGRYLLDHSTEGMRVSIRNSVTGAPPLQLPTTHFHDALNCPG
jgi:hypothetical protein